MTEDGRQRTEKLACKAHPAKDLFGFSLIELLVVISIIAMVLAILMPGLGKARATANRTRCAGNLKQINLAMHLYIGSNNDTYPCAEDPLSTTPYYWLWMGRGWRGFIAPYLGGKIDANNPSVLLCPADKIAPQKWESTSYSYSMAFYHSPRQIDDMNSIEDTYMPPAKPSVPQKCVNVARPAEKIIVGEWLSNHRRIEQGNDQAWWGWAGSRNFLFVDGQVRFLDANDIRPANDGNPNPNLTTHGIKGSDWPR
jgi:prepilin-type N-terminal cleavage/methylation domain-containing protein/prepilin-type processing-associated H-X9-DG protein